jgi:rhamnose utilization protein RhaD (predicted bifunctional aldolase and dehydrogenase)
MQSLWRDEDAASFEGPLAQRVYTSRLLGKDHALVLHGGGNTSVKIRQRNLFGDDEDILYVKGSGWDLETIEAAGFAPVRLQTALRLAQLDRLSDAQMVQELRAAMTNPSAPTPSTTHTPTRCWRSQTPPTASSGCATSTATRWW